jgi:hypothetical protein
VKSRGRLPNDLVGEVVPVVVKVVRAIVDSSTAAPNEHGAAFSPTATAAPGRHGVCHKRECGLLAGEVTYDTEPLEPPPDGRILVCCSRPRSELTLDR